ncbi:hypothetical protein V6R21_23070 [Limibacter armeniacum]|uniref:hypothetical protein n=1 Tax=Limibacter armeniacum TaxID=466084 RepID=UPI002FE56DF5
MSKKIYIQLATLLITFLTSCTFVDVDPEPERLASNELYSRRGVTIDLEWSTGGTDYDAVHEADIDLQLFLYGDLIASSERDYDFESVEIFDEDPRGTYDLDVIYYEGCRDVYYTLYITSSETGDMITIDGHFDGCDGGDDYHTFHIRKDGDYYIVN